MMSFEFMSIYTHCMPLYQVYKYTPDEETEAKAFP
jgi:hypothetical protein